MAIALLPNAANEENAGSFAGLLASSFMIGRAVSSYAWGKWADRYGRTTILFVSLALSSLFSILFGMARSFIWALVFRGLLGLSNGIMGTTKTLVSELANDNQVLETRGMALVIGMRGWGFLLSPAIGGSLAEVVKQYPTSNWVMRFEPFLSKYPFLLPNIVGAAFCILSLIVVKLCIKETLPKEQLHGPGEIVADGLGWCRRLLCIPQTSHDKEEEEAQLIIKAASTTSYSSSDGVNGDDEKTFESHSRNGLSLSSSASTPITSNKHVNHEGHDQPTTITVASIWSRRDTRQHLIMYWVYSFVIISVDEALDRKSVV